MKKINSNRYLVADDVSLFNDQFLSLYDLYHSIRHGQEFSTKYSKYLSPSDRIEITRSNVAMDQLYWKYFDKLIKKIRGLQ